MLYGFTTVDVADGVLVEVLLVGEFSDDLANELELLHQWILHKLLVHS